jgi:hypothetical protein
VLQISTRTVLKALKESLCAFIRVQTPLTPLDPHATKGVRSRVDNAEGDPPGSDSSGMAAITGAVGRWRKSLVDAKREAVSSCRRCGNCVGPAALKRIMGGRIRVLSTRKHITRASATHRKSNVSL